MHPSLLFLFVLFFLFSRFLSFPFLLSFVSITFPHVLSFSFSLFPLFPWQLSLGLPSLFLFPSFLSLISLSNYFPFEAMHPSLLFLFVLFFLFSRFLSFPF